MNLKEMIQKIDDTGNKIRSSKGVSIFKRIIQPFTSRKGRVIAHCIIAVIFAFIVMWSAYNNIRENNMINDINNSNNLEQNIERR